MKSERQRIFYFREWAKVVEANQWWHQRGRQLIVREDRLSPEGKSMLATAEQIAAAAHRALKVGDLRHACHVVALGRDVSSNDLTSDQLDRVLALFAVLADPESLNARRDWDAYARGENPGAARRVEYVIRRAPDAYVRAVSAGIFGTRHWEELSAPQKSKLAATLSHRSNADRGQFKRHPAGAGHQAVNGHQADKNNQATPVGVVEQPEPDWSVE